MLGQAVAGLSQVGYMGAGPKTAANWFPAEQRTMATAVSMYSKRQ